MKASITHVFFITLSICAVISVSYGCVLQDPSIHQFSEGVLPFTVLLNLHLYPINLIFYSPHIITNSPQILTLTCTQWTVSCGQLVYQNGGKNAKQTAGGVRTESRSPVLRGSSCHWFLTYASQFLFEDLVKTLKVRKQVCFKLQRGWAWRELRG